jgi:ABC-type transporter Mla subunit MlaD
LIASRDKNIENLKTEKAALQKQVKSGPELRSSLDSANQIIRKLNKDVDELRAKVSSVNLQRTTTQAQLEHANAILNTTEQHLCEPVRAQRELGRSLDAANGIAYFAEESAVRAEQKAALAEEEASIA